MIGTAYATRHPDRISRMIVMNTGGFHLPKGKSFPWPLRLGRSTAVGGWLIRRLNAFCVGTAVIGCTKRRMPREVRSAMIAPYDSWQNRIAVHRFVQDIPLGEGDKAWPLVQAMGRKLPEYADRPAFIGWGLGDFVFDHHFLKGFTDALPQAEVHAFQDAGHYVLEDKAAELVPAIRAFLDRNPLG